LVLVGCFSSQKDNFLLDGPSTTTATVFDWRVNGEWRNPATTSVCQHPQATSIQTTKKGQAAAATTTDDDDDDDDLVVDRRILLRFSGIAKIDGLIDCFSVRGVSEYSESPS
jgi:hypothetical protein